MTYLPPFLIGLIASLLMTRCWIAVSKGRIFQACMYEAGAMFITNFVWELWATSGHNLMILNIEGVGAVLGTYLAMRRQALVG